MNRATCVFLVILRLAIGWHFFFEGWNKIRSHAVGETTTSKPWTSEGFFREAYGPAGPVFRGLIGDPDDLIRPKLRDNPQPAKIDIPQALSHEWDENLQRWATYYNFTPEQRTRAEAKLAEAKAKTAEWFRSKSKDVKKTFPSGVAEVTLTNQKRIDEYFAKVAEVRAALDQKLPAFGRDVEGANLRTLKADAARLRKDLQSDLDAEWEAAKKGLQEVFDNRQKDMPPPEPLPVPSAQLQSRLDTFTMWFLCVGGSCLLMGIFTRTACVGLAGFLALITLSAPAVPYAPAPPGAIGYYIFVNLYVIEMLALLMIATTRSGRWLGFDALIHAIFGPRRLARIAKKRGVAHVVHAKTH